MKEYLRKNQDGVYVLELSCDQEAQEQHDNNWIEVPEGAEKLLFSWINNNHKHFVSSDNKLMSVEDIMNGDGYWYGNAQEYICSISPDIIWQRPQQPEDLPFINDKPKSINDQYAEIEQVRQDDINKPNHYASSSIECIDAMQAMMTHEQFIGFLRGNVFKYQWRYEKKNGIEDLKKAQWYLNKLTIKVAEKDAPF